MITYQKINKNILEKWDVKLFETDASYFQYPYYCSGYEFMPNSSCEHFTINLNEEEIAFVSILNVKVGFLKIGLIIRGPVILKDNNEHEILKGLQNIQKKEGYFFLRINPNLGDDLIVAALENSPAVIKGNYFPIYNGSQSFDFVIDKAKSEEELLANYKPRARQSIRYALEEEFKIEVTSEIEELQEVYELFKKAAIKKEFTYRSYASYKSILENGSLNNLATLYLAKKDNVLVNALFIVKDKRGYTYFSGALSEGNYKPRNSPATLLQHKAITDCLMNENKKYYNISYTSTSHPVYIFKSSFNPREIKYPEYYTITNNKILCDIFLYFIFKMAPRIKKLIRKKHGNK